VRAIAGLLTVALSAAAVSGCAERVLLAVRLYYKPPPVPAQLSPKVLVTRFIDARRPDDGGGEPMRVGTRYNFGPLFILIKTEKIMATRPWPPDLALAIMAALRGQGFDATVTNGIPADFNGDVLTGEVRDFSLDERFVPAGWGMARAAEAHINVILRLRDRHGSVVVERHISDRTRRGTDFIRDGWSQGVLNQTLEDFSRKVATDHRLLKALRRND
jgi:hypothetical protein